MIALEHLTKTYGGNRGVTDLTFHVPPGSCYGFLGPNGAGKSTTIRVLLGLIAPTSGSARILGLDCTRQRTHIVSQVGYMPSEAAFYPEWRVEEILRLSARLRGKATGQEIKTLCDVLELDGKKRIRELSLGNRKKVSIVCAMAHRPRLYLLDEPTSGLDPLAQHIFWQLLEERRQEGASVFLSSHTLSEVQRHCDRAAILREGRLVQEGSVLVETGTKRVSLAGVGQAPELPGVSGVRREEKGISFLYSGSVQALLSALAQLPVDDVHIAEPDLEEIFLHYYTCE